MLPEQEESAGFRDAGRPEATETSPSSTDPSKCAQTLVLSTPAKASGFGGSTAKVARRFLTPGARQTTTAVRKDSAESSLPVADDDVSSAATFRVRCTCLFQPTGARTSTSEPRSWACTKPLSIMGPAPKNRSASMGSNSVDPWHFRC